MHANDAISYDDICPDDDNDREPLCRVCGCFLWTEKHAPDCPLDEHDDEEPDEA